MSQLSSVIVQNVFLVFSWLEKAYRRLKPKLWFASNDPGAEVS
jgi:hypothetical protein